MSTARFGLSDGVDHDVIDAVLAALELHDHEGGTRLTGPTGAPSLLASPVNGTLPGSSTFFYRYSFVDKYGFETAASAEQAVSTPEMLTAPTGPDLQNVEGGLLARGLYYYFLSAVADVNDQTDLSPAAVINVVPGQGSVQVNAPVVDQPGVESYNVWRQGPGEAGPTKVGSFTVGQTGWVDDGSVPPDDCACDPDKMPPAFALTNSSNRVLISLAEQDAQALLAGFATGQISRWRLYRSVTSGGFGTRSLLATIGPGVDGTLPVDYIDDGSATLVQGAPSDVDRTMQPSVQVTSGGGGGGNVPNPTLMAPDHSLWTVDLTPNGVLHAVSGSWGAGYSLGQGPIFTDANSLTWRLAVANDGLLSTYRDTPVPKVDTVYPANDGPLLAATSSVRYRLGVDSDGALTPALVEQGEPYEYPRGVVLTEQDAGGVPGATRDFYLVGYDGSVEVIDVAQVEGTNP